MPTILASTSREFRLMAKLSLFVMLGLWFFLSYFNLVSSLILPSPLRVAEAVDDVGFALIWHAFATYARLAFCLFAGSVIGITLGILMQYSVVFYQFMDGILESWRPVPVIALLPFVILIFGFSEEGKLLLGTVGVALVMVVSTIEAIARVPTRLLELGIVIGLTRRQMFSEIIIPYMAPLLRAGTRIALAIGATLVIASEFMGAQYGLGYLINVARATLTTPTIFLCIIIIGILGYMFDAFVRGLFNRIGAWQQLGAQDL